MGVIDTKTLILNELLPQLTAKFDTNKDGVVSASENVAEYNRQIVLMTQNIDKIPPLTNVEINVDVTGDPIPGSWTEAGGPGDNNEPIALASGGVFSAGQPAWTGEEGPEMVIPEVDGRVLNHTDSMNLVREMAAGRGSGGDTYITVTDSLAARMLMAQMHLDERMQAEGLMG
jgi:hypothetical protein